MMAVREWLLDVQNPLQEIRCSYYLVRSDEMVGCLLASSMVLLAYRGKETNNGAPLGLGSLCDRCLSEMLPCLLDGQVVLTVKQLELNFDGGDL